MPKTPDSPRDSQLAGTHTPDRANTNAKVQSLKACAAMPPARPCAPIKV